MRQSILLLLMLLCLGCNVIPQSKSPLYTTYSPTFSKRISSEFSTPALKPSHTVEFPIITPSPTLNPTDASIKILDLIQNNGGCLFPCWWNFTPHVTNTNAVRSMFSNLMALAVASISNENGEYVRWLLPNNEAALDIQVDISFDDQSPELIENVNVTIQIIKTSEDGEREMDWENQNLRQHFQSYSLPQILNTYGKPNGIYIFANEGWKQFELILDFADKGYVIWYSMPLENLEDKFLGCTSKAFVDLYLWDPKQEHNWVYGISSILGGDAYFVESMQRDFLSLEKASTINLDEFYNIFNNSKNEDCISTQKDLWPGP